MKVDVADQLGAVVREVRHGERSGAPVHVVAASRTYATEVEDLWDAISNPERLPRWFLPVSGDLRQGGRYQLQGNAGGEIERCEPPRRLAVTWEFGGGVSWLEVRLTGEGPGRTRLELEHTVPDDDHWAQFGAGATGVGWDLGLMGLAAHVAGGGEARDPGEAMAWMTSPEGRDFMTRSSGQWERAAVAGGADEADAAAAAARTTAFYTGGPPAS